jgi:hypothetical protein
MPDKLIRVGPVAMANGTYATDIFNPADAGAGAVGYTPSATRAKLTHIRIVNTTSGALSFKLYIGATGANAAGTEFEGTGLVIAANDAYDWYGELLFDPADFLVGGGSGAGLTFQAEGYVWLA